jgi:hypothetical protein
MSVERIVGKGGIPSHTFLAQGGGISGQTQSFVVSPEVVFPPHGR